MGRRHASKVVVGLEIEPGRITAARVSVNGRIVVEQVAAAPLEPHVVRDGEVNDAEALADALRQLWADNKGLGNRVRVGIASARVVIRTMDLPPVHDEKELDAAVRFRAQDELPMPLADAVIDHRSVGLVETAEGTRHRVVVVAARRDLIERVLLAVRAAGLRPEGVDLSAFAMLRALQHDTEPTIFVAIGGLTNLVVTSRDAGPFTRVTGSGLEAVSMLIAERCELPLAEVRGLIGEVGLEGDEELDDTGVIVRAALSEAVRRVAGEIRSSLDFHTANATGAVTAPERVVLTGAAVMVPGMAEALSAELGLAVETRAIDVAPDAGVLHPALASVAGGLAVEEVPA